MPAKKATKKKAVKKSTKKSRSSSPEFNEEMLERSIERGIERSIHNFVSKFNDSKTCSHTKHSSCCSGGSGLYFIGFIGAAIYYISNATGFWNGVLGVLKALVWPAFLVFDALKFLGMQ